MALTIDVVVNSLLEGLDKKPADYELARKALLEYQAANQMSLRELNELCWKDSTYMFDIIYG